MLITCPKCKKCHNVDDGLIPAKATMVRCRTCGHRFPIPGRGSKPDMYLVKPKTERPAAPPREPSPQPEPVHVASHQGPRVIGVMISKGGVGKTTTAVNISAGLASMGKKVLLVDTDTQGQSAYALGVDPKAGLARLVTGEAGPEEAVVKARDNLWLVAGGKSLAGIKRMIDRKEFGGEMTLKESLSPLIGQYDYVIVDSSPGWDPITVNVLFFVREVLIPVSLEVMPLQGLREFQKSFSAVARYNDDLELRYIVPTFLDLRVKHPRSIYKKLKELYPAEMCPPIRYNVRLSEAPAYGMTIFEYAPSSNGAEDYLTLLDRIVADERAAPLAVRGLQNREDDRANLSQQASVSG